MDKRINLLRSKTPKAPAFGFGQMTSNGVKRINKRCANFPCHHHLQDCTFCFCPLYPCRNQTRGKYIFSKKQNEKVWSCRKCSWIHKKEVVDNIFWSIKKEHSLLSVTRGDPKHENTGVVILAHGSKLENTKETALGVSDSVKRNLKLKHIMPAYLQLCPPSLSDVIEQFVGKGCRKIIIVPYFLFNGNHVTRDIPSAIEKEKDRFPKINLICTKGLSEDGRTMSSIVTDRIKEVM